jgi:O-succinylbenzoic acid--CoA ligase
MRANISASSIAVPNTKSQEMELSRMIEKSGATHISLVPTQLYRLMQDNSTVKLLQKLKAILVGGGVMADELTKECLKNKLNIFKSYGLSEMASQVTTTAPSDLPKHMNSSGKLLAYRELAISLDNQILVKGKTLFSGYNGSKENKLKDKLKNKLCSTQYRQPAPGFYLPVDSDGWFHTGDTGYIDEEGYLHVIGRMDQMFVSKGENIYPEEIENAILGYPGIEEAVVVPIKDRDAGKVCAAFIRFGATGIALQNAENLSPGKIPEIAKNSILQEKLERYLTLKIEKVKIPKYYFDLPKSPNTHLKPNREKLKSLASKLVRL